MKFKVKFRVDKYYNDGFINVHDNKLNGILTKDSVTGNIVGKKLILHVECIYHKIKSVFDFDDMEYVSEINVTFNLDDTNILLTFPEEYTAIGTVYYVDKYDSIIQKKSDAKLTILGELSSNSV